MEEIFQSCHDQLMMTLEPRIGLIQEEEEHKIVVREMRDKLPFFKDPKIKLSIWTIIKDSIGKDLTKMSVPVYFNSPLSLL
jgi:hypothetical protein